MHQTRTYHRVLTIAGSDSGGGAGIQADLKTIAANGCYGMSVVTALTAQNTRGVTAIHAVPVDFVTAQLDAVLGDIGCDAVKIGMLFSSELIRAVAAGLRRHGVTAIVLDPVMIAQSGHKLLQDEAIAALKEELIPMATIITPNLPEAEILLNREVVSLADIHQGAAQLAELGCQNVLIKGGHLTGDSDDHLYLGGDRRLVVLPAGRTSTVNNHGTGCTLSAAIASFIALGKEIEPAVRLAKEYISGAIAAGATYQLGNGHGPVHHFYRHW